MIRALRQLVGGVVGVAAVVLPAWAIFHLIRQGSCGDVGMPTCPDEVAVWILSLVGAIVILSPIAIFVAGRDAATGRMLLLGPILVLTPIAFVAGIVVSLVGVSADRDSQWIGFVLGGIAVLIVVRVVIWAIRVARAAMPALTAHPVETAQMQQLATVLQQVQATQEPTPTPKPTPKPKPKPKASPDPDLAARLRKLDELHAAGIIDDAEHRRRRDEILAEI